MKNQFQELENLLKNSFEDLRLSNSEKYSLVTIASSLNDEMKRYLKNKSFDIVRSAMVKEMTVAENIAALGWLERSIKAIDGQVDYSEPKICFSPGSDCKRAILDSCHAAKHSIDICVFTISDNEISNALLKAKERGVRVRIITDDDKSEDKGSDIDRLADLGIAVRMDRSPSHMHHKFALFDEQALLNGSFNWTRSASERNQENIMLSYHPSAISTFARKFEALWESFR